MVEKWRGERDLIKYKYSIGLEKDIHFKLATDLAAIVTRHFPSHQIYSAT